MDVSYFSEQTPQEREGRGCDSEPTPLVPLVACVLMVGMMMALLQVSWASPIVAGTVLLVVMAALRNRIEEAQQMAAREAQASQETPQKPSRPEEGQGQSEPPFQKVARPDRRFNGDRLWGRN